MCCLFIPTGRYAPAFENAKCECLVAAETETLIRFGTAVKTSSVSCVHRLTGSGRRRPEVAAMWSVKRFAISLFTANGDVNVAPKFIYYTLTAGAARKRIATSGEKSFNITFFPKCRRPPVRLPARHSSRATLEARIYSDANVLSDGKRSNGEQM